LQGVGFQAARPGRADSRCPGEQRTRLSEKEAAARLDAEVPNFFKQTGERYQPH
jgi:uncharacterized protein (DUF4415 family)